MFDNVTKLFGQLGPGMCRISLNGEIAVKTDNGYKTYNVKTGTLTNVSNFSFDIGDELFFVIPTNKVKVGDIILVSNKPKCVTAVDKNVITAIDYETSEVRQIVPERHMFMGNLYFYGKIVSMFGNSFTKGKGLGNVMKMMLFSQMLGGKNKDNNSNNLGQIMAMSMLMGKDNSFDNMFDFSFDEDSDDDNDNDE